MRQKAPECHRVSISPSIPSQESEQMDEATSVRSLQGGITSMEGLRKRVTPPSTLYQRGGKESKRVYSSSTARQNVSLVLIYCLPLESNSAVDKTSAIGPAASSSKRHSAKYQHLLEVAGSKKTVGAPLTANAPARTGMRNLVPTETNSHVRRHRGRKIENQNWGTRRDIADSWIAHKKSTKR